MGNESSHELVEDHVPSRTLKSRDLTSVAQLIKDGKARRIVVMTGAGISTSAGIPDFRSPETGLYANLARLNLPYAEAVFDISYFRENPKPFYLLARELYPGKYKPTVAHSFIYLLFKKDLLRMLFTQNIDCLERTAGIPDEKIVEAHGSFASQRCIECKTGYSDELMYEKVHKAEVPHCTVPQCNGLVKPDIVFFGEQLPERFHQNRELPSEADLAIVIGTSLSVQPFASLPQFVSDDVPRVLFNMERVGGLGSRPDDVCVLGDCDSGIRMLADELGWREELEQEWKKVSGTTSEDVVKAPRSKDEAIEDEVDRLTKEIDDSLRFSSGHVDWVKKGLADEKRPGEFQDELPVHNRDLELRTASPSNTISDDATSKHVGTNSATNKSEADKDAHSNTIPSSATKAANTGSATDEKDFSQELEASPSGSDAKL